MRQELIKICERRELAEMIYMSADGSLTKRRIRILSVGEGSFKAYCFLRREKRTFKIESVLSIRRVISRESWAI
ncbi:transcriptional regulator [Sporosarcina highlanderae]|uniref:Transcriptional regulator n=1 Tax=Sporosarcina highlanderae TaxID=3035916 RepID=A0ABT8JNA9_9BACL|nr:transcriptional regulator [Sporosarcina highlanderae]MDN4606640.1 transcriptional regulator [Sporosarcina highlanderae]